MLSFQPTPIILLKEGTDTSQGVPQLVSNINACQVIAEAVRTTLGPRGMDKLIVDDRGKHEATDFPGLPVNTQVLENGFRTMSCVVVLE